MRMQGCNSIENELALDFKHQETGVGKCCSDMEERLVILRTVLCRWDFPMLFDWLMLNFPIFLGHCQETIMSLNYA